eukprot:g31098.t1
MMGSNSVEAAQVDQLGETVRDIKEHRVQRVQERFDLPNWCALAEKSLPPGPGPFLVGGKVSLADILFYTLLLAPGCFFDNAEGAKAAFQNCPKLKAALEATDALPQLKEYISKRKETPF